ncbi:MAG: MutH/Sau3AI family endonuclease [Myxococcota bacterium]
MAAGDGRSRRPAPQSRRELEVRASALSGRRVADIVAGLGWALPLEPVRAKGFVGQLVEAALGADPKAGCRPDFPQLAIELKTVPIGRHGRPAESTFCCSVNMAAADREEWESSRLKQRIACVLWMPVEAAAVASLPERRFGAHRLWAPSPEQLDALRADWEDLIGAIGTGNAPTANQGRLLQVRPKAASSRDRTLAPGAGGPQRTLPLGFYLRSSFVTEILT